MNKQEILATLQMLAKSQGLYGRLLSDWERFDIMDEALEELESMNFSDAVELIIFIES